MRATHRPRRGASGVSLGGGGQGRGGLSASRSAPKPGSAHLLARGPRVGALSRGCSLSTTFSRGAGSQGLGPGVLDSDWEGAVPPGQGQRLAWPGTPRARIGAGGAAGTAPGWRGPHAGAAA